MIINGITTKNPDFGEEVEQVRQVNARLTRSNKVNTIVRRIPESRITFTITDTDAIINSVVAAINTTTPFVFVDWEGDSWTVTNVTGTMMITRQLNRSSITLTFLGIKT